MGNFRCIKGLNMKNKTLKLLEGNTGEYLYDYEEEIISQYTKGTVHKRKEYIKK